MTRNELNNSLYFNPYTTIERFLNTSDISIYAALISYGL